MLKIKKRPVTQLFSNESASVGQARPVIRFLLLALIGLAGFGVTYGMVHWSSMPPAMTTSAQATSASLKSSVLRLISRTSQDCGNIAATVISPSGAAVYRAPTSLQTSE